MPSAHDTNGTFEEPRGMTRSVSEPGTDAVYLRGGGVLTDGRRALRLVLGFSCVALTALLVVLAIDAVRDGHRANRLREHGVPVSFVVTSCLGLASGTGATEYAYECRGTFMLSGTSYVEVLRGSATQLATGTVVAALVDPRDPGSVTKSSATKALHSTAGRWLPTDVTLLALVLVAVALAWNAKRPQRIVRSD